MHIDVSKNVKRKNRLFIITTSLFFLLILTCELVMAKAHAASNASVQDDITDTLNAIYMDLIEEHEITTWDSRQISVLKDCQDTVDFIRTLFAQMKDNKYIIHQDQDELRFWFAEPLKSDYRESSISASISRNGFDIRADMKSTLGLSDYFCILSYDKSVSGMSLSLLQRFPGDMTDRKYDVVVDAGICSIYKNNEPLMSKILASWDNEMNGENEFLRCVDLAPLFDLYEKASYEIRFDICSKKQGTIHVYMQNGSNARYAFEATVHSETEYTGQSIIVTPALVDEAIKESFLSFYGSYGTGIIPSVKNIQVIKLD